MPIGSRDDVERDALSTVPEILRRRWSLMLAIVLACMVVSLVRHETASKSYQATASVTFGNATLTDAALQVSRGSGDPERDAATNVLIASSREVADGVRTELKSPASANTLLSAVSVEAAPNANVIHITASTSNAVYSARLANAFADQYIAFETQSQIAAIDAAQADLQRQIDALPTDSPDRATLRQSLQRLSELRAVASGGVQIISRATPPGAPSGPGIKTTVLLGILIGLALSTTIVFVLEALDRRVNSLAAFEREYRLPVLAGIPQAAFREGRAADREKTLEPYRILRSALDFAAVGSQMDTLLVTSAVPGEGKTTVAVDLAHAIALTGRHVVLVELDLRRPSFADHFAINPRRGVSLALTQRAGLGDLLVQPLPALPNLLVLPSGPLPPNPSELLGSEALTEVLGELAGEGMVVIDAPALNDVADAQVLLNNPAIHAALVVARFGRTTRDQVQRARTILDRHVLQPMGVVVCGVRDGRVAERRQQTASSLDDEAPRRHRSISGPRRTSR